MATFKTLVSPKEISSTQDVLDDSWLECSICLEALTRNHRVLPCQHTFCLPCLEDLATSTKTKNEKKFSDETDNTNSVHQNKEFLCPECRAPVETSLDKLPSNVILNRILEGREKGVANVTKPVRNVKEVNAPKDYKSASPKKTQTQTEKTSSTRCDKYNAFAEAAREINEQKSSKTQLVQKINNFDRKSTSDKMSMSSCDILMQTDIKPPTIPPPPIPGNLSTNPFVQMVVSEVLPSTSQTNIEKENVKEGCKKSTSSIDKEKVTLLSNNNQRNQANTSQYELLSQSSQGSPCLKAIPSLPPRSLSIASPISSAKFTSPNPASVQGSPKIHSGTSSMSTSGAEDGSSPESPAPSLPPKPSFSYSNISSKNLDLSRKQSTEILGIRSTNIPPPVQPPPPLPMHQKKSLQQQIEKELSAEKKLSIPPTRATVGGMPHQVYRALYDYAPSRGDELELHRNELYFVFEKCQDGWFKGSGLATLKTGVFPGNYVQHVQVDSNVESQLGSSKGPNKSFLKENSEKSFINDNITSQSSSSNDLIDFSKDTFDRQVNNQMVKLRPDGLGGLECVPNKTTGQPSKMVPTLYRATTSYPASSQYELDLKEGDIVILIKKREDGWCKGTLQKSGVTGLFPFSFVEKINS